MRPNTKNEGAGKERSCWMAKLRRMNSEQHRAILDELLEWGAGRTKRDNAKAGGLGRTWKAKSKGKSKRAPRGQGRG